MNVLTISGLACRYNGQPVLQDLSLNLADNEILCLLGASGCGKTTLLKAIAGLVPVAAGEIHLHGRPVQGSGGSLPPEARQLGFIFQDYALFPHLNVRNNIGFGLRNVDEKQREQRTTEMLNVVGMDDFGERYIHELSGGQQQRVALARALAPRPDLVLLDEPFSNLDVEMRDYLSQEVRRILKSQGATGILVTHDQMEAFAVGDQIGVMENGRIVQRDTAYNLYHSPTSFFVADFIGQGVFLDGTLLAPDKVETSIGIISGDRAYEWPRGSKVKLLLRPDDIVHDEEGELSGEVYKKAFKGAEILYTLRLASGTEVLSLFPSHHNYEIGDRVPIRLAPDHMIVFKA